MNIQETIQAAAIQAGAAIMEIYTYPETDWEVERKADNSPLTLADRRSHAVIAPILEATGIPVLSEEGIHLPYEARKDWKQLWVVDPLDGTKEFLKRNDEFTVNIALVENGSPILGVIYVPALYRLYWGEVGQGAWVADVDRETLAVGVARALPTEDLNQSHPCRVVASRSHLSEATQSFINNLEQQYGAVETVSAGSSLKLCLVAAGQADVYPRLAPTMEWDTAAGHAIAVAAGCEVVDAETGQPLHYNKEDLHNPFFLVKRS